MTSEDIYLGSPDNPKTAAIVGYITVIGWMIAYFMLYLPNKNSFAAFHLRQTLLLHILSFILNVLSLLALWKWFPYGIVVAFAIVLFILWLLGAFRAINGEEKPVPFVGKLAQEMFRDL
jgi:uncharacterized membrane protein